MDPLNLLRIMPAKGATGVAAAIFLVAKSLSLPAAAALSQMEKL
jgi:hypothetical protein